MIQVGVVGYGHWGPNYTRILELELDASLAFVCDASPQRCALAERRHPDVLVTDTLDVALLASGVDAVIVATPAETHTPVALAALELGYHVLVEKPLGLDSAEIELLSDAADAAARTLMVDHTYLFSDGFRELRDVVNDQGGLEPFTYRSLRTNTGHVAGRVGVLRDLAVHDLSILDLLHHDAPVRVSAVRPELGGGADMVELRLTYPNGSLAVISVGWGISPPTRRAILDFSDATVVYDDRAPSPTVQVFSPRATTGRSACTASSPGPESPGASTDREPLQRAVRHFFEALTNDASPLTNSASALRVAHILDAARESLASGRDDVMPGEVQVLR